MQTCWVQCRQKPLVSVCLSGCTACAAARATATGGEALLRSIARLSYDDDCGPSVRHGVRVCLCGPEPASQLGRVFAEAIYRSLPLPLRPCACARSPTFTRIRPQQKRGEWRSSSRQPALFFPRNSSVASIRQHLHTPSLPNSCISHQLATPATMGKGKDGRQKVVIIGAGIGGVSTAARLAKAGLEVIVVEKVCALHRLPLSASIPCRAPSRLSRSLQEAPHRERIGERGVEADGCKEGLALACRHSTARSSSVQLLTLYLSCHSPSRLPRMTTLAEDARSSTQKMPTATPSGEREHRLLFP